MRKNTESKGDSTYIPTDLEEGVGKLSRRLLKVSLLEPIKQEGGVVERHSPPTLVTDRRGKPLMMCVSYLRQPEESSESASISAYELPVQLTLDGLVERTRLVSRVACEAGPSGNVLLSTSFGSGSVEAEFPAGTGRIALLTMKRCLTDDFDFPTRN